MLTNSRALPPQPKRPPQATAYAVPLKKPQRATPNLVERSKQKDPVDRRKPVENSGVTRDGKRLSASQLNLVAQLVEEPSVELLLQGRELDPVNVKVPADFSASKLEVCESCNRRFAHHVIQRHRALCTYNKGFFKDRPVYDRKRVFQNMVRDKNAPRLSVFSSHGEPLPGTLVSRSTPAAAGMADPHKKSKSKPRVKNKPVPTAKSRPARSKSSTQRKR